MKNTNTSKEIERVSLNQKIGMMFTAMSTLLLEFSLIRVLSVSLWYHFAFMIISIALLGFGISGVTLVLSTRIGKIETNKFFTLVSMLFGISIPLSFMVINKIPFEPFSFLTDSNQFVYLPLFYLSITIPFFLAGIVVGSLFSRFQKEINKLYFFDLFGAGLSCVVFIIVIPIFGGSGGIAFASILAGLSSIAFSLKKSNVSLIGTVGGVVILIVNGLFLTNPDAYLPISTSHYKYYGEYLKEHPEQKILTEWNTFSRVDVVKDEDAPVDNYPVYIAIIDAGNSTTNIPNVPKVVDSLSPPFDASNLAMVLKPDSANVFIVGSGGGGEILSALSHKANTVTAVEINGILNDLIKKDFANHWTAGIARNKKVNIITDDARGYLRSKRLKFDVIISAHTISASATASGAMSLVENYILTEEAIKDYLQHLKLDGVLYISRPEPQIPRLVTTIKKSYMEMSGVNSKNHFFIFKRPPSDYEKDISYLSGVVYKKDGLNELEIQLLKTVANLMGLEIVYDPVSNQEGIYKDIIQSDNLAETLKKYPQILTPATDDNPYFEHQTKFSNIGTLDIKESFSQTERAMLSLVQRPAAESTLIILLIQASILSILLILMPIYLRFRKEPLLKKIKKWNYAVYFSLLGLGYIMIEICLIQKFTLFLGQPVYTLLTVISTLLIFSGFGSLLSDRIIKTLKNSITVVFVLIAVLAILIGFLNPLIFDLFVRADILIKVLISVIVIGPMAFLMGVPFPYGMKRIPADNRYLIAYSWGINGFFSVIGSILVVMLSMSYGFKAVFAIAGVIYLAAFVISRMLKPELQ